MATGKVRDKGKEAWWRRTVRRQGRSGLSVRAFCQKQGVREAAFYFWRRELVRREAAEGAAKLALAERPGAAFVPVRLAGIPAASAAGEAVGRAVRAGEAAAAVWRHGPASVPDAGRIEIILSGGGRVHVAPPVDRQALADVLAVLSEVGPGGEEARPC
jgi:hypothetical protein